mgnify:CR=1 FL=1
MREKEIKMLKYIILITAKLIEPVGKLEEECRQKQVELHYVLPEKTTLISETLYITDDEEIAKELMEEKANVLVWLHEDNKGQNFSCTPYAFENIEEIDFAYIERVYQRFRKLPWTICETQRCIIREMTEEDIDAIYDIYSGESITRYMEGLYEDRKEELEFMRSYIENEYTFWGYGTWLIVRKEDEKIIGRVGFNMREGFEEPEMGFVVGEKYQRQGYALECCKAALKVGKDDYEFEKVQVLVKKGNVASVQLSEKLGFMLEQEVEIEEENYLRYTLKI